MSDTCRIVPLHHANRAADCGVTLNPMDGARDAHSPLLSTSAPGSPILTDPERAAAVFQESVAIMARLRAPDGCPWDREQSFDTIRKYTLEEAYEVFDAIERRDFPHLAEELGDLLLQVLFYAEMAANEGHFTISDVLEHLNRKLVRRHPHVFGEEASRAAGNAAAVDLGGAGSGGGVTRNVEGCGGRCRGWRRRPGWGRRRPRRGLTGLTGAGCCRRSPRRWLSWRWKPR